MRKFKLTPLLAALAAAVSVNAFATDASEDISAYPTMEDIKQSIQLADYTTNNTLVGQVVTAKETTARKNQWWLNTINRPYDNVLGTNNGSGVVVGVVDTGAQTDHKALDGQFAATYNAFTKGTAITDERAHGTMVSGIIAGHIDADSNYEGVAPGAKLAMFKAFRASGTTTNAIVAQGINWAVAQKVSILNLSLGSTSAVYANEILNATNNGVLVVAAMGNNGTAGAMYPAKYASNALMNNRIIAVGALSADANVRASFSSWDPKLASWTVFAPGNKIYSSYSDPTMYNTFAGMSGTSFSAPMVSGQAALIKSNWNFLKAETVAQIIFNTATRLCSNGGDGMTGVTQCNMAGPDPMFGWGLINVGKSLQPVGKLTLATQTGNVVLSGTNQLVSAKGGTSAAMTGLSTIGVDNFNRGFLVSLGSTVTSATTTTSSTPVTSTATTVSTAGGAKFTSEYAYANTAMGFGESAMTLGKASYSFAGQDGSGYGVGFGGTSANYFGLQAAGNTPLSLSGQAAKFNTAYYGFADNGTHAGYTMALNDTTVLRIGAMTQGEGTAKALGTVTDNSQMMLGTVELQKKFGNDTVVITAGNMQETNAALGMRGTGAMALNANTSTDFVSFAGSKQVAANTYVSAMVSFGNTGEYSNSAASLVNGASATQSQAWSLGIAQKSVFKDNDSLGFTVSMPLRTMSGDVSVTTATAQSQEDGSLTYATQRMALAPSGMEKDLELSYTRAQFGGNLSAIAQAKLEPGHVAGAATQYGIGFKWMKAF